MNILNLDIDLISCQICSIKYSLFENIPYTITCGHSFCLICIDKLNQDSFITCPLDKKKFPINVGVNKVISKCKNKELIKFLIMIKLFKKIDLYVFYSYAFEFCDDCGVFIISSSRDKHIFQGHKLLKLQQFQSKYINCNMYTKEESDLYKYYYIIKYLYMPNYSLLNPINFDVQDYIMDEKYYLISFNIDSKLSKIGEIFRNGLGKCDNIMKFGYLIKNKIKVLGFFNYDSDNSNINIFGLFFEKSTNKQINYFFGYLNFNKHNYNIKLNFGIYIESDKLMFGRLFSEDDRQLLYGDSLNLKNKEFYSIPLNNKYENQHQFSFNNIKTFHTIFKEDQNEFIEENYIVNYEFDSYLLNFILVEKNLFMIENYCKIDFPLGKIENFILFDIWINFLFFGMNKIQVKITNKGLIFLFPSNYGIIVEFDNLSYESDFSNSINILYAIRLQEFNDNFSKFIVEFSKIFNEKLSANFIITYKFFNNLMDFEVDGSKENFRFDLTSNTIICKELSGEYITINYSLKCKNINDLINEIHSEINQVSNILLTEKKRKNDQKLNEEFKTFSENKTIKSSKKNINCECIII